ncbi:MAG TPA: hypothetical protein PKA64_19030 [Myxococcota bacterium]|nr:hypothetical protein [Myxococcota bacterium]
MEPTSPRLTFADAAQERAWWAWFAQERAPILRGGFATLVAGMLLFAPMDRVVFPELAGAVIAVRLAAATALAFAFPAFFGRQAGATLATHGQEWLLYAWVVAFAGLGTIGWIVAPYVPAAHLMITLVTLCILLAGLYGANGLRVRYGAPLAYASNAMGFRVVCAPVLP